MNHLQTLTASRHDFGCDPGMCGLDLFLGDGDYLTLQTEDAAARRVLAKTGCNLVRVVLEGEPARLALVDGWPYPWHAGRLTLNEIAPDENVRLHSRVALARVPDRFVREAWELVKETAWVRVQGPAQAACSPLLAEFPDGPGCGGGELRAGDLRLSPGVRLASPAGQVLFRLDASSALASGVSSGASLV